jgi:hypothetical protein
MASRSTFVCGRATWLAARWPSLPRRSAEGPLRERMSAMETPCERLAPEGLGKRTRCGMARSPPPPSDSVRLEERPPGTELRIGAGLELSGAVRTTGPRLELRDVVSGAALGLERDGPMELAPRELVEGEDRLGAE